METIGRQDVALLFLETLSLGVVLDTRGINSPSAEFLKLRMEMAMRGIKPATGDNRALLVWLASSMLEVKDKGKAASMPEIVEIKKQISNGELYIQSANFLEAFYKHENSL